MKTKKIIDKVLNDFAQRNQYSSWEEFLGDAQSLTFEALEFEEEIAEVIHETLSLQEQEFKAKIELLKTNFARPDYYKWKDVLDIIDLCLEDDNEEQQQEGEK